MFWVRLRPTFEILLTLDRAEVIERLRRQCSQIAQASRFRMHGEYGELHLAKEEHRLWSPHLSFYVTDADKHSLLHGRFAPRLEVWTCVWAIYLAMTFSAFFGLILGYAQWMLGERPWGLMVVATATVVILALYLIANIGQQWSADQMAALRLRLEEILENAELKEDR